jgi:hypothetical protein
MTFEVRQDPNAAGVIEFWVYDGDNMVAGPFATKARAEAVAKRMNDAAAARQAAAQIDEDEKAAEAARLQAPKG